MKLRIVLGANAAGLAMALVPAFAADNIWTNPAGGNWEDATSWSDGAVPDSTDTVKVGSNGSYTVTVGNNAANTVPNSFTNFRLVVDAIGSGSTTLELTYTNAIGFRLTDRVELGDGTLTINLPNGSLSAASSLAMGDVIGKTGMVNVVAGSMGVSLLSVGNSDGALSTINVLTGTTFGAIGNSRIGGVGGGTAQINIHGGHVALGGGSMGYQAGTTGRIVMTSGSLFLTNSSAIFGIGAGTIDSARKGFGEVIISNGSFFVSGGVSLLIGSGTDSQGGQGHGVVKVFGGSHTNLANIFMGSAINSTGQVLIAGGEWTIRQDWRVGAGSNALGTITVSNGTFRVPNPDPRHILLGTGNAGRGELHVAGGVVELGNIGTTTGQRLEVGVASGGTGLVHVTGGELRVLNQGGGGLIIGTNTSTHGQVILDGGLVQLRRITVGANGILSNRTGGVLEFLPDPTLGAGADPFVSGTGAKIVDGGTLSYKNFPSLNVTSAVSKFAVVSGSGLQLNSSTNQNIVGTYALADSAGTFKTLRLTGAGPRWQSDSLQVSAGTMLHVSNATAARVNSVVTNQGTIRVQTSTVTFEKPVVNSGRYISDPSTNTFADSVTLTASGTLEGGVGDLFDFKKSLTIQSTNNLQFSLHQSDVLFSGGGAHTNAITGADFGSNAFFAVNNFGYGRLAIGSAADTIFFTSGDLAPSNALYAQFVDLLGTNSNVANLDAPNGIHIYYLLSEHEPRNAYLFDQTYTLASGGLLLPAVPEPSALAFALMTCIVFLRGRRRTRNG